LEATARPINAVSARDFIVAKLKELNPHWGQAGPEAQVRKPRRKKHKATKKKPQLTEHEKPLWELIRRRLQGPQYCRGADELRISPPWKDCPPTYVAVYKLEGKWRHRIEAERSRIKRKMENLTKLTKNISREEK
jgi:hypothetical protein